MNIKKLKSSFVENNKLHAIHWVVLAFSIIVTLSAWYVTKSHNQTKIENHFNKEADQIIELITERMLTYEDALWSGVAAMNLNTNELTPRQWEDYSQSLRLTKRYPGINGIGVIYNVQKNELKEYLKKQRKFRPAFKVHPQHNQDEYWPITFIEPVASNSKAVGLDMAFEANRYSATLNAKKTGTAQMTGPIVLVQDSEKTPGFLLFVPFYDQDKKIKGIVYAPFIVKNLLKGILSKNKRHVGIKIQDKAETLYNENTASEKQFDQDPLFKKTTTLDLYGRKWDFEIQSNTSFNIATNSTQPLIILIAGILIDLLLLALFYSLSRSNHNAVYYGKKMSQKYKAKAEMLKKSNEAKSAFLTNMSHEIRTPMNGIVSCANLLLQNSKDKLSKEDRKYLKTIIFCGHTLINLINDILDLSKIESRTLELQNKKFDFQDSITSLIDLYTAEARVKDINIVLNLEHEVPRCLNADEIKIHQILGNILSNAIKYTSDKIEITISAKKLKNIDEYELTFSILDNGIGIPKKEVSTIFNSFSRIDNSATKEFGGTGLGLAISKGLIQQMQGKIWVETQESKGTNFYFTIKAMAEDKTFDLQKKQEQEAYTKENNTIPEIGKKIPFNILIVEDNLINQMVLKKYLMRLGYKPDVAINGLEALEKIYHEQYDIIFMDQHMPIMDGIQATKKIVEKLGESRPKIIGLTASAMKEDEKRCLEAGMNYFLTKPIDLDKIIATLEKCAEPQ